jgi:hypothetical protein
MVIKYFTRFQVSFEMAFLWCAYVCVQSISVHNIFIFIIDHFTSKKVIQFSNMLNLSFSNNLQSSIAASNAIRQVNTSL